MAEVISIIKYFCAAAAGAVTALGSLYFYSSVYTSRPLMRRPMRILITGAAGQIGYALAPLITQGLMCGSNTPVYLHMHDAQAALNNLNAVEMELLDVASHLLLGIVVTHDLEVACQDVDVAVLLSGSPAKPGSNREELTARSASLYRTIGAALDQHANRDVKVVVVPQPAHTCAHVLQAAAPSLDLRNITVLSRLSHNRTLAQVAEHLAIGVSSVRNVIVWGNAISMQVPDVEHGTVMGVPMQNVVDDEFVAELTTAVQQRNNIIVRARNLTPALSAAAAICDHVRDWLLGTPQGEWVSMGVASDGSYGVPDGLVFSFPVTCEDGHWHIVQGLDISERLRRELQSCIEDVLVERDLSGQNS